MLWRSLLKRASAPRSAVEAQLRRDPVHRGVAQGLASEKKAHPARGGGGGPVALPFLASVSDSCSSLRSWEPGLRAKPLPGTAAEFQVQCLGELLAGLSGFEVSKCPRIRE